LGGPAATLGTRSNAPERRLQIFDKRRERPFGGCAAGDQYIIRPRPPLIRQNLRRGGAHSALCPIAHHGIPNFAAGGEPNPYRAAVQTQRLRRGLQDETRRHGLAAARRHPQEVGANLQGCKSAGR
jgi:hypothetical protein